MAQQPSRVHEFFRKRIVSLKRKPQMIALVFLVLAFVYYAFNLSSISNTTALINAPHMGLSGFCNMLFSTLGLVCFLNSFPHRKKVNIPMLVLMFAMLGILIYCDTFYAARITEAITRADHPIVVDANTAYIPKAYDVLMAHRVIVVIGALLTALTPVIGKLLRRIDTSLPVEEGAEMKDLHLSNEA